ncbi:MAG TPA: TorF family putative porin [Burkholderiales bacterium]
MPKSILASAIAAALAMPMAARAQSESPHSLTGNVGFFSQYVFRGLTQTDRKPALQGGFDHAHASGLYAGTWASNISWLADFGAYESSSLEWDFYGGYKGGMGDFGYDVGLLQYYYPGKVAPGANRANTLEAYGALSWKWLAAKLSYSVGDKTFGVGDSRGTYYLDLSATYPLTEKLSLLAHYGIQKFKGNDPALAASNDELASYKDWKLGASYALADGFTAGLYYTDTDMSAEQRDFYTSPAGRELGEGSATVYVQKAF